MGSICYCYEKEFWVILDEGRLTYNDKIAYRVEVGKWEDDSDGGTLSVMMLKEVYEKIIKNEYIVINQPFSEMPLIVKDKKNNTINLLGYEEYWR